MIRVWMRRLLVAMTAAVLVASVAACGSSGSDIPDFQPGPGKFRVVPHPTDGAPASQLIHFDDRRVQASLGYVTRSQSDVTASMEFVLQDVRIIRHSTRYRTGDYQTIGPVTIRIDGVYGSGYHDIAVDIALSLTKTSEGSP